MGWLSALKLVPWSEVIEAAPGLVRGARRMFAHSQDLSSGAEEAAAAATPAAADPDSAAALRAQLQQVSARLEALARQQQDSAALIESLTEHNARLVEAVQVLRLRQRWLAGGIAALAVAVLALALWR
ncbi:hypothetical protein [Azohydromonas aeria]|uniref:hypothetical protein n=1 Tax=Azohydromonas aeria TaxID=2590212 RepID=UPI0012F96C94|nr:hypothetical protein [Azohydromonas aeria]